MSDVHQRFLETLRRLQFASPERLVAQNLGLIERLARHAHENIPYYRERLGGVLKDGHFRREAWFDIPLLTRAEVQSNAKDLLATTVPAQVGEKVRGSTSGTSGSPLEFYQSHVAMIASECQFERMLEVHGIDRTAHMARIRGNRSAPYPQGSETTGWNLTCPTSRLSALDVRTPIAEQAAWLLDRKPQYLTTHPSNATALAQRLESIGASLPLSGVITVGEHVTAEQRSVVTRVFGCRLFDNYGASEVGYLAFECPAGTGYHIAYESVLIEVTDETGATLPPGKLGRVVVTPLYNYAMPFIRYSIGDYAVAADGPCPCGRTLPRLASLAGRVRNIFSFADGSQQSPWGWRSRLWPLVQARQMQIVQTAMDTIEIRYVPHEGAPAPDIVRLNEAGRRYIHPTITMRAVPVDEIPREPTGKIEDCFSLVTPALR